MRESSSLVGNSKAFRGLEYFDDIPEVLPCESLCDGGVSAYFDGNMVDFVDFGVDVSNESNPPKLYCLLLDAGLGLGLGLTSEFGLVGVGWKLLTLIPWLSGLFAGSCCRSSQFHHHG